MKKRKRFAVMLSLVCAAVLPLTAAGAQGKQTGQEPATPTELARSFGVGPQGLLGGYQWGSAPERKGLTVYPDPVLENGRYYAQATIPADAEDEYVTALFDVHSLSSQPNPDVPVVGQTPFHTLPGYLGLVDDRGLEFDFLSVALHGGGSGSAFIQNESGCAYEIVAIQLNPSIRNYYNNVAYVWNDALTETIRNDAAFSAFYQENQAQVDAGSFTPTAAMLTDLQMNYGQDGIDGYNVLINKAYPIGNEGNMYDAALALFEPHQPNGFRLISGAGSIDENGGLIYDIARYHIYDMTYLLFEHTSSYSQVIDIPGQRLSAYGTGETDALDQISDVAVDAGVRYELPVSVYTSARRTGNAFNGMNSIVDFGFQVVLRRTDMPPPREEDPVPPEAETPGAEPPILAQLPEQQAGPLRFEVENTLEPRESSQHTTGTGDRLWWVYLAAAGGALALVVGGYALYQRRKKKETGE